MTAEEQRTLHERLGELVAIADGGPTTAAAILLLTDRLVGVLDGILSALRAIEDKLNNDLDERIP
jgi:hypothetical protein